MTCVIPGINRGVGRWGVDCSGQFVWCIVFFSSYRYRLLSFVASQLNSRWFILRTLRRLPCLRRLCRRIRSSDAARTPPGSMPRLSATTSSTVEALASTGVAEVAITELDIEGAAAGDYLNVSGSTHRFCPTFANV